MQPKLAGIVFDIDGTLLRGSVLLRGVPAVLDELRQRGLRLAFFTNDNREKTAVWSHRLNSLGIQVFPDEIITSALVAAEFVAERYPASRILPIGDVGLIDALQTKEVQLVGMEETADIVVMGKDPNFNQQRLHDVCQQIWNGATFIATNNDPKMPVANGYIPGTGAMVNAVVYATGVQPLVTGKPALEAGRAVLTRMGLSANELMIVGDQLATDIQMGKAVGMKTVLVLTGTSSQTDVNIMPPEMQPDYVIPDLTYLLSLLD
ncbi:MAG: HAD-IIA family hydrolase [Chloroflexota bacterium]